jgi:hypothetical protein
MLLSAGERISMALLSLAIHELGGDAISFTGSQSGIITNDRHIDARIIEVRPFRVQDELARGKIVVVAGYQGVSYKKEVTTLGRGGSDTTAVAMAAALDADYCEICSDVDGVYSADPRVVPTARRIATLSYEETQEMAEAGAKVLNAQAVEFAKEKGIAIYARATAGPLPASTPHRRDRCPAIAAAYARLGGRGREREGCDRPASGSEGFRTSSRSSDERSVAGKQLHVFDKRVDMVISRGEPARRTASSRRAAVAFRRTSAPRRWPGGRQRCGRRHQCELCERSQGVGAARRERDNAVDDRDIIIPHHVDGAARADGGSRPRSAPPVHRDGAASAACVTERDGFEA